MAYKGRYRVNNSQKYIGDPTNVIYRSLLERRFMIYCDTNKSILKWGSEEIVVPYRSPKDSKIHRSFVDFIVHTQNKNNDTETLLVEVKPFKQCQEPEKRSKLTKKYLTEVYNWGINQAKWNAATEFARSRGWKFIVITEKTLAS